VKILNFKTYLKISVIDSGIGISKEDLAEIRERLKRETDYTDHIGVYNTNKRLVLFYGEEYGIRILSKYGVGTVIQMIIPIASPSHEQFPIMDINENNS
jgi:two-component system sensor histidine kinase YesM